MDKKLYKFLSEYSNIEFSKVNKNIFEISGFPHYETVFNNVLAFFLDSSESTTEAVLLDVADMLVEMLSMGYND